MSDGTALGDNGSVLDFMSMKSYPDMSLDISMLNSLGNNAFNSVVLMLRSGSIKRNVHNDQTFHLNSLGKTVKKEPGNEEGQQHFDDTDKLLQEFQEAQVDRVGSRPSSNLSSLSNASERDQHHLGICRRTRKKRHVLIARLCQTTKQTVLECEIYI